MKVSIIILITIFFLLFGVINYYIGLRGWQALSRFLPVLSRKIYWCIFWFIALSYLIARIGEKYLPGQINSIITIVGSYWMAAMLYLLLFLGVYDLLRLLNKWVRILPLDTRSSTNINSYFGITVIVIVAVMLIYGTWNARTPKIVHYEVNISKKTSGLQNLHAVMVSDVHLGTIMDNDRLTVMVDKMNELNPDIILLAGDIIEEKVEPFVKQRMAENFLRLKPKFGVFSVLGNHEYIGGEAEEAISNLNQGGVRVLRDNYILVDNSFYLIGRDDLSSQRFNQKQRKSLEDISVDIDKSMPIILLDHQPSQLDEADKAGADLQLSGHTHRGQMFPNQILTKKIFEIDWGYLKKGNLNVIVSSGFGTWGPPIRIGTRSEIVDIKVNFIEPTSLK
jgi:uncharacterized protein